MDDDDCGIKGNDRNIRKMKCNHREHHLVYAI